MQIWFQIVKCFFIVSDKSSHFGKFGCCLFSKKSSAACYHEDLIKGSYKSAMFCITDKVCASIFHPRKTFFKCWDADDWIYGTWISPRFFMTWNWPIEVTQILQIDLYRKSRLDLFEKFHVAEMSGSWI